jgi:diadenosine tetraphosphate (Ap4A) HIT family hydrolase
MPSAGSLCIVRRVPYPPDEFYARAMAHADAEGRLPVPEVVTWDTCPFVAEGLRTKPLAAPVLPEPPRRGEDPAECTRCADPERDAVWSDERWVLAPTGEPIGLPFEALLMPRAHLDLGDLDETHAAELGILTVRIDRAVRALGHIGRVHVYKWGDGGAHLHMIFIARPEGVLQLRGTFLPLWGEMLPRVPEDVTAADLRAVATALAEGGGRAHV